MDVKQANNSGSKADYDFCDYVKLFDQNTKGSLRPLSTCCKVGPMQKPEASTINFVIARGLGKAKVIDSASADLLLLKRDLRSSVRAKGRLVGA